MPVFQVDMQFRQNTEYWTTKLYIIATDVADATTFANAWAGLMRDNMAQDCFVDKARITPMPAVRNVYRDVPMSMQGTAPFATPGPLFNVARWGFGKNYGRQVHHYIRGTFPPSAIGNDGNFTAAALASQNAIVADILEHPQIVCDKNGNQYTYGSCAPAVGMRQLRRGSKRKKTPVI